MSEVSAEPMSQVGLNTCPLSNMFTFASHPTQGHKSFQVEKCITYMYITDVNLVKNMNKQDAISKNKSQYMQPKHTSHRLVCSPSQLLRVSARSVLNHKSSVDDASAAPMNVKFC